MFVDAALGLLVALGVGCLVVPRGRAARTVLDAPGGRSRLALGRGRRRAARGDSTASDPVVLVVAQVSALLRAGAPPGHAWTRATGVRADPQGIPDLESLAAIVGERHTALAIVAASRLAAQVGAPLAGVLDEIGTAVAAENRGRADREAAFAGPQTTARVLGWLPLGGVLLGVILGANPIGSALDGSIGSLAVVLGAGFLLAGRRWSARLVDRARQADGSP